jgi:hypothetical protein
MEDEHTSMGVEWELKSSHLVSLIVLSCNLDFQDLGECPDLDYDLYHFCSNRWEWVSFPGYTFDAEGSCEDEDPLR